MALNVTGFSSSALDYKAFHDDAVVNTMVGNVTGAAGRLYHLHFDNVGGAAVYYKIYFSAEASTANDPDMKVFVGATDAEILEIPGGVPFTELSYHCTTDIGPANSPTASGTTVKLFGVTS